MSVVVIIGQNMPDELSDKLVEMHDLAVIFEPLPECVEACRERYEESLVIEAACGEEFGVHDFRIYNDHGVSSSLGTASESAKQLYANVDWTPHATLQVQVVQPDAVLRMLGIDDIDALLIDAQGMDLAILKRMSSWLGSIKYIQCEAGDLYDGVPGNSEAEFLKFMSAYPEYEFHKLPNRVEFNPDLCWILKE